MPLPDTDKMWLLRRASIYLAPAFLLAGCDDDGSTGPELPEPFGRSAYIADVVFDFSSHVRLAPGSDNWPITWARDGHQYAIWGDGGGFGGTNEDGRVSWGVARIEGEHDSYVGINRHGGKNAEFPSQSVGYSWGLLSVDGTLYAFAGDSRSELFSSEDLGATWRSAGWSFGTHDGPFSIATLLNFGMDYVGARDQYVYVFAPSAYVDWPVMSDGVDLARVPVDRIRRRDAYQFFAGFDGAGNPAWSHEIDDRKPILQWPGRVHWTVNVAHIPGIDRYLLSFNSGSADGPGRLVIFDAPEPWGPWTVAKSFEDFGGFGYTYAYHFPARWARDCGRAFTMVFSGREKNDSWNTVDGKFILHAGARRPESSDSACLAEE